MIHATNIHPDSFSRFLKPTALICALLLCLCSCASAGSGPLDTLKEEAVSFFEPDSKDADFKGTVCENRFVYTAGQPVSTFSSDADTASYTLFRRLVNTGYNLEQLSATAGNLLRTEEMVNYFSYDCPAPDGNLFGIAASLAPCPYSDTFLLKLTMATEKTERSEKNNLVFLIDVSGSMASKDKLELLKKAFGFLVNRLDEDDTVSIVTYAGKEEVVLEDCPGSHKETILSAVNALEAGGATNGEAGLTKAYQLADANYIEGGNNRIFMASDGDMNVGISSAEELKAYISEKRNSGVYLSVLGFGQGNYRDSAMEALADNGNGVYLYIDGETEAEKVFGEDLFANLYTVAEDVKLQISFNPQTVEAYRLVGYENRLLSNEDFENDRKDAGEVGAGKTLTVLYELRLNKGFQTAQNPDFGALRIRYKDPGKTESKEETFTLGKDVYTETPDDDFLFAAAVAECSAILRNSAYKGNASLEHLSALLSKIDAKGDLYKEQFKELIGILIERKAMS